MSAYICSSSSLKAWERASSEISVWAVYEGRRPWTYLVERRVFPLGVGELGCPVLGDLAGLGEEGVGFLELTLEIEGAHRGRWRRRLIGT